MKKVFVAVGVLLATGCASYPASPPSRHIASIPDNNYVAVQDFIINGKLPDRHEKFPMYAIVVLSNDNKNNRKHIRWVCEAFNRLPPVSSGQKGDIGYIPQDRMTPTYWLLQNDTDKTSCAAMEQQYDFDRAKAVFSLAGRAGQSGTLLIAYRDNKVAVLDITKAGRRWTKTMVATWSAALQANRMQDIKVEGGLIADACAAITGDEARRVEAAVYEVVKRPFRKGLSG